jgi:hypothetical protein
MTFSITIPASAWEEAGDENDRRNRLLTTLVVNGVSLHLEAWAVRRDRSGVQYFACDPARECEDRIYEAVAADGGFSTLRIRRRAYAIIATPYCD